MNVSIDEESARQLDAMSQQDMMPSRSAMVRALIRREWNRRKGVPTLGELVDREERLASLAANTADWVEGD